MTASAYADARWGVSDPPCFENLSGVGTLSVSGLDAISRGRHLKRQQACQLSIVYIS